MLRAMSQTLRERVASLVEEGKTERVGEHDFLALMTLESGMRYGLLAADAKETGQPRWGVVADSTLRAFGPGQENVLLEVLEHKRVDFEQRIEEAAEAHALPSLELVLSFPAIPLVRAMIRSESAHFCRMGLLWLLPSELRELRADIVACSENDDFPRSVRELAAHLVVAE